MSEIIPAGYYDAVAVETADEQGALAFARLSLTAKGDRKVTAQFQILNPPAGFSVRFPIWWNGTFTEKSARRTVESLRLMGFKGDDMLAIETQRLDQIVSVLVEHGEWEGKTTPRVAFVNAPQSGNGIVKIKNPMTDDAKRQFAAMMRGKISSVPDVDGERYVAASDGGFGGGQDLDDLPF